MKGPAPRVKIRPQLPVTLRAVAAAENGTQEPSFTAIYGDGSFNPEVIKACVIRIDQYLPAVKQILEGRHDVDVMSIHSRREYVPWNRALLLAFATMVRLMAAALGDAYCLEGGSDSVAKLVRIYEDYLPVIEEMGLIERLEEPVICPDPTMLEQYELDQLPPIQRAIISCHKESCHPCDNLGTEIWIRLHPEEL